MFRLACSILGRSDEAQDMMQDVAERILRRQEDLEDVRNMDSFLARAVRNACIDRIRRRRETTPKIPDVPDTAVCTAKQVSIPGMEATFLFPILADPTAMLSKNGKIPFLLMPLIPVWCCDC